MKETEKKVARYIVKANGEIVDWSFSEDKAWKIARKFEYECMNQDYPVFPIMEVVEEFMQ